LDNLELVSVNTRLKLKDKEMMSQYASRSYSKLEICINNNMPCCGQYSLSDGI